MDYFALVLTFRSTSQTAGRFAMDVSRYNATVGTLCQSQFGRREYHLLGGAGQPSVMPECFHRSNHRL